MIINCKEISESIRTELKEKVEKMDRKPKLVVIQVGDDYASSKYVRNKEKACGQVGIESETYHLNESVETADVLFLIDELNEDESVDGIMVQLPLPEHLPENVILSRIRADKDADGFVDSNKAKLFGNRQQMAFSRPATPRGIITILDSIGFEYEGKDALVIGRSQIVGLPVAKMLLDRNCSVEICHSKSRNLIEKCRKADLIVSAVGRPQFITPMYLSGWKKQVLVDVGINRGADGKLCGDMSRLIYGEPNVQITSVPGGVGVMTVTSLLQNVVDLAESHNLK